MNKNCFHRMNLGSHALTVLRRVTVNDHNEKMDESKVDYQLDGTNLIFFGSSASSG